ncbi:MAG: hypothetical protein J4400_00435 [Candidatus Aenigmarchaeota archaeon]|nr:hypothetical protein [Candidatus Aenigmarchaeota archaeon]
MSKYQALNESALAASMAMVGFIAWIVAVIWHGFLGGPSMMGYMYPRFSYMNPANSVALLIAFVVAAYVVGFLVARFYNWNLKRK